MHDAVMLEEKGLPTAVVITSVFVHEAEVQRAALGMESLEPVVIAHPLSTLTGEEILGRAREAAGQVKRIWSGD